MSLLSYQLSLKKYQRELGLDARTFNALDVKYDDINLLKQLQILNPVIVAPASAPPANTGFYGTFYITNEAGGEMNPIDLQAKLAYNNVDITSYITITSGATETLSVPIGSRLPNPSSYLQLKLIIDEGVMSVNSEDFTGFEPISSTSNPLTEENIVELLVDSGEIDGGNLTLILIVAS
ncbi:hypothetical protein CpVVM_18 [Chrysochromulina parva virophage Moe]|nr:hypothetical protein CpVVM_18 [Chrysochromulina parva virophage Moe]